MVFLKYLQINCYSFILNQIPPHLPLRKGGEQLPPLKRGIEGDLKGTE